MKPDEIGRSYDSIAEQWLAPHLRANGIAQVERAIAFCRQRGFALDAGCGCSGRFIDLVISKGFQVEALDLSERMLALARERHPDVTFYKGDICTWEFPRSYDLVIGWDSIWHVPLSDQEPMLRKICRGLNPGGVFVFTTGGLDAPEEKTDSAMGPPVYYSVLGIPRTVEVLHEEGCICRHLEYDQWPEKHLYVIAQRR
jgi:SAM-dependent methyltransferase